MGLSAVHVLYTIQTNFHTVKPFTFKKSVNCLSSYILKLDNYIS